MTTDCFFISYSIKDLDLAKKIYYSLKLAEINIWMAPIDIPLGASWDIEVEKALKKCNTIIFILSKSSVKSPEVQNELSYASEKKKKIIPLKITDCEIPYRFRRNQYIDFTKNEEIAASELEKILGATSKIIIPPIGCRWKKMIFSKNTLLLSLLVLLISLGTIITNDMPESIVVIDNEDTTFTKPKENVPTDSLSDNELQTSDKIAINFVTDGHVSNMPYKSEFNSDTLFYSGDVKKKIPAGLGTLIYQPDKANLKIFAGTFENGKAIEGKIWSTPNYDAEGEELINDLYYDGEILSGKPNGYGINYNENTIHKGYFKNGEFDGKGETYINGNLKIDGNWNSGKLHGFCVIHITNSLKIETFFKNGISNGIGKLFNNNNLIFEGHFENNQVVKGVMYYENGDKYNGTFKNSKKNGYGTIIWKNGERYVGNWLNDIQHGEGELYSSSGALLKKGVWNNGYFQN